MAEFVLALDQGTTSSRAILFDKGGAVRGTAQQEFRQIFPPSSQGGAEGTQGWVEHDPFDILTSQMSAAVEVLGTERPAARSTTRSCGRTGGRLRSASS